MCNLIACNIVATKVFVYCDLFNMAEIACVLSMNCVL